ncbi:DUF4862 family protein [Microterricola viridarii]|uniref:DUF4862 domain-containing protein n=1 Tax=Microterricola viridarii TaxID=412690 RepID=A0A1H1TI81_9MICO|nr:DUF4862 family protein [Microterricola viridarii]SDS59910.1 protein of unknown function [Microterricola viridarii]
MRLLVSSYTLSPAHAHWDEAVEQEFLGRLSALPGVDAIEIPWLGRIHPHDDDWMLRAFPRGIGLAITPLPFVMRRSGESQRYGLASPDADGRRAALEDMARLRDDVAVLHGRGIGPVLFVELHSAPRGGGTALALERSLTEIASWDWQGAELLLEHCDSDTGTHAFEKGFLSLEQEIRAIRDSAAPVQLWLNWARSAIELRDPDAVAGAVRTAAESGLLAGLAFSSVSPRSSAYGPAWVDAHLPFDRRGVEGSILTAERVQAALEAAAGVEWLGLKLSPHHGENSIDQVVDTVRSHQLVLPSRR